MGFVELPAPLTMGMRLSAETFLVLICKYRGLGICYRPVETPGGSKGIYELFVGHAKIIASDIFVLALLIETAKFEAVVGWREEIGW